MFLTHFQNIGRDLFDRGLVTSSAGNLSIRLGDRMLITRRGSRLGHLQESDLIETGVSRNDRFTPLASSELPVHRAIYQNTPALAVLHAHPPHIVALSMAEKDIDFKGAEGISDAWRLPVLGWGVDVVAGGLAETIAINLKTHRIAVVHGHGTFAIGQLLEEAYNLTAALEESCQVACLLRSLKVNPAPLI